ncbi:hypothetical protein NDL67_000307 [Staphylococcus pseudintermedius]|uniref:Uncharacterized protein n=1 Tax=Staphylococcus pseudintermedius TaxID=283734 RepID=A0A7T7SVZ1_STAPS|nr:hypothetical protein [Staphylococcus pseudintermedius]EGQ1279739.1 hypothetical protein [Staphylococcus pseudintermedius]EGQ1612685.1 hypothetical protein [Staphylococcus pseudintermedius]EGQ1680005.1 hypothetical protein [Staphylococcus pseudintermedius]EGQ2687469.1 hypothetical protein [Staphylococcus pseudintermedius]EGQ2886372.1 hypothetical protein [Staphylococcus pseudintermedius]
MDTKKIKILGIISNVFLILGLILLVFVSAWIALVCFLISLGLSLVLFNMLFHGKRAVKIIVNIAYFVVLCAVGVMIYMSR